MSKSEYNIVLGKLAPPYPDGLVKFRRILVSPEKAVIKARLSLSFHSVPAWHDDPLYFAAERVRAKRRQSRA